MKKATETADTQDWRKKYFDSLASIEKDEKRFRALEAVLKRAAGRLCVASLGQSPRLDGEIKKLQTAMRGEPDSAVLEQITTALTDAIGALDARSDAPSHATSAASVAPLQAPQVVQVQAAAFDDAQLRSVLATLLVELRRDPSLTIKVDELDAQLGKSLTQETLPTVLASLTELVAQRIQRIERAKQEVEALLGQLVGRLDEIGHFVVAQTQNQNQSLASSESLNNQLTGEMLAMGESVDAASDLVQVRAQVRGRLDSIARHLQDFQQRETARATEMRARNEQMQARVAELEAEANRLHGQLKDEQKQATMDVLTKVPNRLAYEKRIDEELKRVQRFKQAACLAVWDVDHFKRVNDTYGHRAGDGVLRAVAESLAGRIRGTDFFGRYGGEEFVMILSGAQVQAAMRLVDDMRVGIEQLKMHSRGTPLAVTISCGVTLLTETDTAASAFDRADKALYKAKQAGRNRCLSSE